MRHEGMPERMRTLLPHDIRLYARRMWRHPNDPSREYDFYDDNGPEDGEALRYLVDDDSPLVPENWGDIVVLNFARGCLKTTTATMAADWAVSEYPIVEVDVTAPREAQFREVMDRFKGAAKNSGIDQLRTKDNISHQKFERVLEQEDGTKTPVEADVKARTAYGDGDALRGLHGHMGIIDEFQDVDEGMFSTFLEAVDQSVPQVEYFPVIIVIGTPKMDNSFFGDLWKMSDQKDWDADENEWVSQDDADEFIPQALKERREELRAEVADLKEFVEEETDVAYEEVEDAETFSDDVADTVTEIQQKEAAAESIEGYNVTGWHIDQYASPLHNDAKIEFKRQKYTEKKFQNEVLANFYTPENDLLAETHLTGEGGAFDDTRGFEDERRYDDSTVVMGVDWGGGSSEGASDTVIVVAEEYEDVMDIRTIDYLDSDLNKQAELERVEDYMIRYDVDRVAVDEGYGAKQREDLQDGNNIRNAEGYDNVCGVIYGNIKDKDRPKFSDSGFTDSSFCTVARTHMIENMVASMKNGNITVPSADLTDGRDGTQQKLLDHLTAPYTDRVETTDGKKKLKVLADRNDDAFQAFVYCWIAANRFGSQRTLKSIGTQTRAGY